MDAQGVAGGSVITGLALYITWHSLAVVSSMLRTASMWHFAWFACKSHGSSIAHAIWLIILYQFPMTSWFAPVVLNKINIKLNSNPCSVCRIILLLSFTSQPSYACPHAIVVCMQSPHAQLD